MPYQAWGPREYIHQAGVILRNLPGHVCDRLQARLRRPSGTPRGVGKCGSDCRHDSARRSPARGNRGRRGP